MASDPLHDPEFLTSLRRDMLRFADMQLRNREQAEDAVQEALTGALSGREKFASRASLRTWVLSILKNKIVDVLRRKVRENATVNPENDEGLQGFEACLYRLPEASGRIFTMREVLGFDTDEICQTLDITTNNCWVQLHRARLALRACLGANWFGEAA